VRPDIPGGAQAGEGACRRVDHDRAVAAIARGYWSVDVELAERCITALASQPCVVRLSARYVSDLPSPYWSVDVVAATCWEALREATRLCGPRLIPCGESGGRCAVDSSGDDCLEHCVVATAVGGPCGDDTECLDGAFCDSGRTGTCVEGASSRCNAAQCLALGLGHDCVRGTCGDRPDLGEACDELSTDGLRCRSELRCVAGICRAPARRGEACDPSTAFCADGLDCTGTPALCAEPTFPCSAQGIGCPDGEYCDPTGHCSLSPDGAGCDAVVNPAGILPPAQVWLDSCPAGFTCVNPGSRFGTCRPTAPLGASCGPTSPCVEGAQCLAAVCVPYPDPRSNWCGDAGCPDAGVCG